MPRKKISSSNPADTPNNDSATESGADRIASILNEVIKDQEPADPYRPGNHASGNTSNQAPTPLPPPRATPPPQSPPGAVPPPPMAQAASAGKAYGIDLLKTAGRAAVWCAVWAIFGGAIDPDDIS